MELKASVCITIFNENEETISRLLTALNNQTLKPNEIIIIDAKDYGNCSRSKGRNIAIKKAKNEIIAITDAGCVPHKDWLYEITKPFGSTLHEATKGTDVVSGGYRMVAKNSFQKAESVFLGVKQQDIKENFMPSARSMAFTKTIWKKAGGFPEKLGDTAEDTVFNLNLIKAGAKFVVSQNAIVDWQMPTSIKNFYLKIKNYARGDAQSGVWWHPAKKFKTHNLKILSIFLRYILFFYYPYFILIYVVYAYFKAGFYGILLQFVSDFACIIGFSHGILQSSLKRN